jgi:hypothetical protein
MNAAPGQPEHHTPMPARAHRSIDIRNLRGTDPQSRPKDGSLPGDVLAVAQRLPTLGSTKIPCAPSVRRAASPIATASLRGTSIWTLLRSCAKTTLHS